jgi:hypothetical protein
MQTASDERHGWFRLFLQRMGDAATQSRRGRRNLLLRRMMARSYRPN